MKNNKVHIVIVTTWFPPWQSVAVNRMLSFAKYLDKNKYAVDVITVKKKGLQNPIKLEQVDVYYEENNQLFKLPDFTKKSSKLVHYLKVIKKLLITKLFKNEYKNWEKNALKKLEEIHAQNPIDVVISSYAPVAPHLVAMRFVNNYPHVKWVADMRDAMSENFDLTKKEQSYLKKIERLINKRADAISTISEPHVRSFKNIFPKVQYFKEIRNGYDHNVLPKQNYNDEFTISYLGSFYGERKPNTFLKALEELVRNNKMPDKWKLLLVGTQHNFSVPANLKKHVQFSDRVSQAESIEIMSQSDANLLIHPSNGEKGIYTGKLFDYISVKKPIIALIDKVDVAAQLINHTKSGFIADFFSHDEIIQVILNAVDVWENKKTLPFVNTENLHRKYQVKKLESLIEEIESE